MTPNYEYKVYYTLAPFRGTDPALCTDRPLVSDHAICNWKVWEIKESARLDMERKPMLMITLRRDIASTPCPCSKLRDE